MRKNKVKSFLNKLPISNKFQKDVLWNFFSLFFLGFGGILINILVGRFYGLAVLGLFSQVYSFYLISSQFAAGSVHLSVQKYVANLGKGKRDLNVLMLAALYLTFLISLGISLIVFFLRNPLGDLLHSSQFGFGALLTLPSLVLFSLNKNFMALLNGLRFMKSYAFFQILRYTLMVVFLLVLIFGFKVPGEYLPLIFTLTEGVLFFALLFYSFYFWKPWEVILDGKKIKHWLKTHFQFSYKSFLGHILTDMSMRASILILGIFSSDINVGIYSFAATIAEGFMQLTVVLKININPILARLAHLKKYQELNKVISSGKKLTYYFLVPFGLFSILVYPLITKYLVPDQSLTTSWPVYIILIGGVLLAVGYLPFQMVFAQLGKPALYTWLVALTFFVNIVLNFALTPLLDIYGAAIATSAAILSIAVFLRILTKRFTKIRI